MNQRKSKILLVEDEPHIAFNIEFNLKQEGYEVCVAKDGREGLELFKNQGPFNLIILDIMLPEVDGFEVARTIRRSDPKTGILMLTARAAEDDIVNGLETGADDYMTKPFHLKELLLRVKRMAKRSEMLAQQADEAADDVVCGPFRLDFNGLELTRPGSKINLTALEASCLAEFLRNPGQVLTREYLLKQVWGLSGREETRTVDNFIMRLRKYLEKDPSRPKLLRSIRGRGYRFEPEEDVSK